MSKSLELFHGEASPAEARIYARVAAESEVSNLRSQMSLTGQLIGPTCDFARTLPARIPFIQRYKDEQLLAEAIIPDPCFWTPELPFLYRAEVELRRGSEVLAEWSRITGIRRLGVRGKSLFFEGKRFVLRGQWSEFRISNLRSQIERAAALARETWTALVVSLPDDDVCDFASRRGILLIADLGRRQSGLSEMIKELRRLARWPAVVIAVLASDTELPADIQSIAPNLLLAHYVPADEQLQMRPWAQLGFTDVQSPADFVNKAAASRAPVVAIRRAPADSLQQSRAACDALQMELAPYGDFAGYVV